MIELHFPPQLMKRALILIIALIAAITSGVAVFHQFTQQMEMNAEQKVDSESSDDAIAAMLASSLGVMPENTEESSDAMQAEKVSESDGMMEDLTTPPAPSSDGPIVENASSSVATKKSSAVYAAYTQGIIGNGETSVLFFHAPWCPECQAADKQLKALYKEGSPALSLYQVDYDTAKDLKQTYGVVRQTTFVVIDGTGKEIKTIISPSAEVLAALVQ